MIRSMTGFGRASAQAQGYLISVELRSVNHRYFDFSCRLPRQYGFAEEKLKKGKRVTLWTIPFRGLFSFIRVLVIRQGFKDGRWGLWNAISTATYTVNKYLTLYARQNGKPLRTNEAPGTSEKGR